MTNPLTAEPPPTAPRRWSRLLMAPGAKLMFALPMSSKLMLLAAAALVPMAALMALSLQQHWGQRQTAGSELAGTQGGDHLLPLTGGAQKNRGPAPRPGSGGGGRRGGRRQRAGRHPGGRPSAAVDGGDAEAPRPDAAPGQRRGGRQGPA